MGVSILPGSQQRFHDNDENHSFGDAERTG
jgi:hypothetical protein